MREEGILFSAFAPPATPKGQSFARFSIHSEVTPGEIVRTASVAAQCIRKLGLEEFIVTEKVSGDTL
jgi:7-keto-8-aminopelargonate synthetase-like enzyme